MTVFPRGSVIYYRGKYDVFFGRRRKNAASVKTTLLPSAASLPSDAEATASLAVCSSLPAPEIISESLKSEGAFAGADPELFLG